MLYFAASIWLICSLILVWRLRTEVLGTTLIDAWRWSFAASLLWATGWACEFISGIPSGLLDQIWYAVALFLLAALISILGAKRPGSRVWTGFVTLPMLLCLSWPAFFSWIKGWPPSSIRLMTPALGAYAIVCVMGLGNYVGTRFLWSAAWLGMALAWLVIPYSGWNLDSLPTPLDCRLRATFCAGCSLIWPYFLASSSRASLAPWDRVWVDFVNMFGIAWGRRLQDRFNETARKSKWGVQLDFYGLDWEIAEPQLVSHALGRQMASSTTSEIDSAKSQEVLGPQVTNPQPPVWTPEMISALEWLLRRFVDPDWIERRVNPKSKRSTV